VIFQTFVVCIIFYRLGDLNSDDDDAEYLTAESHFEEDDHIVDADAEYFTAESNFEYDYDDGNDNISGEDYHRKKSCSSSIRSP